ncbi:hypothetical protein [Zunongwangia atlantica]|uniref:Uncharacterized protein n=1 Tax=Zunongwangia atlantica 22II14-10F7 TaxID=1185767 RepID=A0A1Y1SYB4_9FLAO|nr:hypothetical protein [Zunongwangia atlantica]ORL43761.1 hypothetical protein IIF7_18954 [Zunongwangia atlantica 22II14-10F7]
MIIFKSENFEIDLSIYGVTLTDESNLFNDATNRSYSLPFTIQADDELLTKLGVPQLDNITNVTTAVKGKLILPERYYEATLFLGEIEGQFIECDISYGDQETPVYDTDLADLPWPIVLAPNLLDYAEETIDKAWPDTAFNFPMVFTPAVAEKDDYELFEGYTNNFYANSFRQNYTSEVEGETIYHNRNVMAPFPYMLEILRFGYAQTGKKLSGPFIEDSLMRKVLYIPENFLEKFRGSEFQNFSFSVPDETINENGQNFGIYRRQFTVQNTGTYEIKIDLNLDPVLATNFALEVYQEEPNNGSKTILFSAASQNNRVKLEEEIKINTTEDMIFDYIKVELKLAFIPESIAANNQFEFNFNSGRLNEFPTYFTLSNFMPDMTFGEFENMLKNWLNLDIDHRDGEVFIDYAQDAVLVKETEDHRHLEIPKPKKAHNTNRFYTLSYANGDKIFYNRNGQVYSDSSNDGEDKITIEMNVQPAIVEQTREEVTAVMPEDRSDFDFMVYSGKIGNSNAKPLADPVLIRELSLQQVFKTKWENWLRYRVHSKSFKESFECSLYEFLDIKKRSFKYHEIHLIKMLRRKFLSEETMQVEIESETF